MTLPAQRTRAILWVRRFLLSLLDPRETPRVPRPIRDEARRVLRHYPLEHDIQRAATEAPDTFGQVDG
jgi:hypothetical protein